jgi:O-antigen/teichoic acid export membrane protein
MRARLAAWPFRFWQWRPGGYLRASGGLLGWLLVRAFAQAALLLLLARLLGADGYGLFVAVLAIAGFFAPLAGLGLSGLLLRDGAQSPGDLPPRLGMALALLWPAVLAFTLIAVPVIAWTLPTSIPLTALVLFSFSEIVAASFVEIAARVEQSQHRVSTFGWLFAGLPMARLVGLLVYAMLLQPAPVGWMWVYASTSLLYTAAVAGRLWRNYQPHWPDKRDWALAREGFPFTVGALSFRAQAEFNKPLLAQASYGQVGNFSVAQRMLDLASLPLQALQEALWPRFYAGTHSRGQIWLITGSLVLLALLGGALLVLAAPLLPRLLGAGFEATANLLASLALLPALQLVRNFLNAVVIANQRRFALMLVYTSGGIAGVLLNLGLVPALGLQGAVWAAYLTEAFMVVMLVLGILMVNRTQNA